MLEPSARGPPRRSLHHRDVYQRDQCLHALHHRDGRPRDQRLHALHH